MAISDNILAKMDDVEAEIENHNLHPEAPTPVTKELHEKAMAAIFNGRGSQQWIDYMTLFAGTPTDETELARLIPTDGTTDDARQEARAYLVANGMCTMATTTRLNEGVSERLD